MTAKRCFDLFFTIPGIILLLPLFFLLSMWIKLNSPGPVFFKQERVGKNGSRFKIFKFRTMIHDAEKVGPLITVGDDRRITRAGRFLRKYKLDELPQLLNVLKGEMSLVGPRPEVPRYVELYTDEQRLALKLLPGITDPASIRYRNENEILDTCADPETMYIEKIVPEKIKINMEYAQKASIFTDLFVLVATVFHFGTEKREIGL